MASNKMLIDASHPEETRVAVVRGNRIEEYDFESQAKKQLRGNIYLAKVTRVEPSLQAAFVDYGGNRHGFLAFSEIHPDYYQIPLADRQALIAEEAAQSDENGDDDEPKPRGRRSRRSNKRTDEDAASESLADETADDMEPEGKMDPAGDGDTEELETGTDDPAGPGEDGDEDPKTVAAVNVADTISEPAPEDDSDDEVKEDPGEGEDSDNTTANAEVKKRPRRRKRAAPSKSRKKTDKESAGETEVAGESEPEAEAAGPNTDEKAAAPKAKSRRGRRGKKEEASEKATPEAVEPAARKGDGDDDDDTVESVGLEDALEEVPFRRTPRRQYKIQEVVKRRQIMLVQVVKEERGNKGAALTTYLSLAGRYSVLMPNTARGGGISRKITNANDRKRLKTIATDLDVQPGMGVILRTAGASRTKAEIKRDFEYLMRLWENVRSLTLSSTAPCLVYEEGSLIKRSIRDLYNKDIGEILVSGDAGYREAKEFMRMLMPSHAKNVKAYAEEQAIFSKFGVEQQLDRLLSAQVTLKSGGYLVINQTEALVSIDVNSGRSTREHSIEDTALQTNLEAADEISRQLRLRDLAGLIVIDFIDMEEKRNNRAVEKRLKEALKNDRARIQVGRISHFGLLEMSRQRIRASVMESTMDVCPHCEGSGFVRSESSIALHVFRSIEDHLSRHYKNDVVVRCPTPIAIDILNTKRTGLFDLESRFGVRIVISADMSLPGQSFIIERGEPAHGVGRQALPVQAGDAGHSAEEIEDNRRETGESDGEDGKPSRNRRKRTGRDDAGRTEQQEERSAQDLQNKDEDGDGDTGDRPRRRRRRGKRGGKRTRPDQEVSRVAREESPDGDIKEPSAQDDGTDQLPTAEKAAEFDADMPPVGAEVVQDNQESDRTDAAGSAHGDKEEGRPTRRARQSRRSEPAENPDTATVTENRSDAESGDKKEKRSGWWSRSGGFF